MKILLSAVLLLFVLCLALLAGATKTELSWVFIGVLLMYMIRERVWVEKYNAELLDKSLKRLHFRMERFEQKAGISAPSFLESTPDYDD